MPSAQLLGSFREYSGQVVRNQWDALIVMAQMVKEAVKEPLVQFTAKQIAASTGSRDPFQHLQAIYQTVKHGNRNIASLPKGVLYVHDNNLFDNYVSPKRLLEWCENGACAEDCLPSETLVMKEGCELVPIGSLKVGDRIMGDGQWVTVKNVWDKGVQDLLGFKLSNGGYLRCTPGHQLFRIPRIKGYAGDRSKAVEVRARDISVDDDLLIQNVLPFGSESLGSDKAWLQGVHIADGWCDDMGMKDGVIRRASISGKDGHRKEAQKEMVREICERLGLETNWQPRWIVIKNKEFAQWLSLCGHTAINKHVPDLNLDEVSVKALIKGLSADAAVTTNTFGTISPLLALQLRVLFRMLGQKTSIRRVDDHGGLGKHPIYRVKPYDKATERLRGSHARVRGIEKAGSGHTVDIEVEGSRFWLPETDLIVHNCDSHAMLNASLAIVLGIDAGVRIWSNPAECPPGVDPRKAPYTHVYAVVRIPDPSGVYSVIPMDTTVVEANVGWEPPQNVLRPEMTIWID